MGFYTTNRKLEYWRIYRLVVLFFLYVYFIFRLPISYNYTNEPSYNVEVVFISLFIMLSNLILERFVYNNYNTKKIVIVLCLLALNFWFIIFQREKLSNEHLCIIVSIFNIIFSFFPYCTDEFRLIFFISGLTASFLVFFYLLNIFFPITFFSDIKLFENTGVFCTFISLQLPYINHLVNQVFKSYSPVGTILLYIFVVGIIIFICNHLQSRTGILICFLYTLYYILRKGKEMKLGKYFGVVIFTSCLVSLLVIINMFNNKVGSSHGRILSFKIALRNVSENFFFGVGVGNFSLFYPKWQSEYFISSSNNSEILFAGEVYNIFNEPLLLFIELGFFGTIILLSLFCIFILGTQKEKLYNSPQFVYFLLFLIASLFYYTFHITPLLFGFILGFFSFSEKERPTITNPSLDRFGKIMFLVFAIGFSACLGFAFNECKNIASWRKLRNSSASIASISNGYKVLYKQLNNNGKFLYDYGEVLSTNSSNDNFTLNILNKSLKLNFSYKTIELLAFVTKRSGRSQESIKFYRFLSSYLPYKLRPRRELMYLYQGCNLIELAKREAENIIRLPIKIRSEEVDQIRNEARLLLAKY